MAWRTRWTVYAALATLPLVGALGGMVLVSGKSPVYSAESRLAVTQIDLNTAQALAANYSRVLTPESVTAKLSATAKQNLISVSASPIPDSNMLRVEATAATPDAAVEAASIGTTTLQSRVSALSGQAKAKATLAEYTKISQQVADAQEKVNASGGRGGQYTANAPRLAALQAQAAALNSKYQSQMNSGSSELSLVRPAVSTGDNVRSRKQIYLLGGFGGGALIAYVIGRLVAGLPERERRPRRSPEPELPREPMARESMAREPMSRELMSREPMLQPDVPEVWPDAGRLLVDDPAPARRAATPHQVRLDSLLDDSLLEGADLVEEHRSVVLPPDPVPATRSAAADPFPAEFTTEFAPQFPVGEMPAPRQPTPRQAQESRRSDQRLHDLRSHDLRPQDQRQPDRRQPDLRQPDPGQQSAPRQPAPRGRAQGPVDDVHDVSVSLNGSGRSYLPPAGTDERVGGSVFGFGTSATPQAAQLPDTHLVPRRPGAGPGGSAAEPRRQGLAGMQGPNAGRGEHPSREAR